MTTTLWVCPSCGTLDVEGGECCDVQRVPFEEALGTQEVLFELTGNDRAQHVLHQLKSLFEAAAEKVNKRAESLAESQRQKEAAGAVLLDFYKLTFVPEAECDEAANNNGAEVTPDGLLQAVADEVNSGSLDGDGVTVTCEVRGGKDEAAERVKAKRGKRLEESHGNLFATSASILHKAMLANGTGVWSNGGVTYELAAADGRLVLLIGGATTEGADADAKLLGTVAGTTFSADYTEALKAGVAHAFVASDPRR